MSSHLVLFCLAAIVLIVTPGPNFPYVLTRGVTQGRRAGLPAAIRESVGRRRGSPDAPARDDRHAARACRLWPGGVLRRQGEAVAAHSRHARVPLAWLTATGFVGLGVWAALPERR
jgi:hypothetical protein